MENRKDIKLNKVYSKYKTKENLIIARSARKL